VVTRVSLRQNISEDVWADIFDGSAPRAYLLWAAALLLEAIADDTPGDPDASAVAPVRALGLAEAPASGGPTWPGERLTDSETRVLRYLPTNLGAAEIAAELYLSTNTVKTHLRHLYRKLGAHSRQEAVQCARAVGLLTGPSRRPLGRPRRVGNDS
jgi:DNA-binding CsgD family transcriptional regulator